MNKKDYLVKINEYKDKIGVWNISFKQNSAAGFVMGYYFNSKNNLFDIFINNERGEQRIRLSTNDELKALDKLLSMVEFEFESSK